MLVRSFFYSIIFIFFSIIVQRQSQGIYTCEARNEAGMDSKDFPLVVLGDSLSLYNIHLLISFN